MQRHEVKGEEFDIIEELICSNEPEKLCYNPSMNGHSKGFGSVEFKIKDIAFAILENEDESPNTFEVYIYHDRYSIWLKDIISTDRYSKLLDRIHSLHKQARDMVHKGYTLQEQINRIMGGT